MRGLHRVSSPLRGGYLHSALLGTTAKCLEITRSRTNGNDMRAPTNPRMLSTDLATLGSRGAARCVEL